MRFSRSLIVLFGTISLLASGVVFAAWTATGSGEGSAVSATAEELDVDATLADDELYPTKSGANVRITVTNPNPYKVQITSITIANDAAVTIATDGDVGDCTDLNHDISVVTGSVSGSDPALPTVIDEDGGANDSVVFDLPVASMGNDSDDDCQGLEFEVSGITVDGESYAP